MVYVRGPPACRHLTESGERSFTQGRPAVASTPQGFRRYSASHKLNEVKGSKEVTMGAKPLNKKSHISVMILLGGIARVCPSY